MSWPSWCLVLIKWGTDWVKERRWQKSDKSTQEKDKPRFRIDISKTTPDHPSVPAYLLKIFSLGGLPLTINNGEVLIKTENYPEYVEPKKFTDREIIPVCPIEIKLALPPKFIDFKGKVNPEVKLKCKFSYCENAHQYEENWTYNHRTAEFDSDGVNQQ